MKFRNPETGEIENDINAVGEKYCNIKQIATLCKDCELERLAKSRGFNSCVNFQNAHPYEAARLMGYEVVEDDRIPQVEKKEANMDKPRICEVLGVEVDEEFTIGENQYFIDKSGDMWCVTKNGEKLKCGTAICCAINHPDRIIRKPRFTEQEVEMARTIKVICPDADRIRCRISGNKGRVQHVCEGNRTMLTIWFDAFPSIQTDEYAKLDEIIGGAK